MQINFISFAKFHRNFSSRQYIYLQSNLVDWIVIDSAF